MRVFQDETGEKWVASVGERAGTDYKGRFFFLMMPQDGSDADGVALTDIRWNSRHTAERTLQTMSTIELRRRLHSARGRTLQVS
jgi:hypothetical protein